MRRFYTGVEIAAIIGAAATAASTGFQIASSAGSGQQTSGIKDPGPDPAEEAERERKERDRAAREARAAAAAQRGRRSTLLTSPGQSQAGIGVQRTNLLGG